MFKPDRGWLVPNPDRQTDSIRSLPFAFDVQPPATLILPALIQLLPT